MNSNRSLTVKQILFGQTLITLLLPMALLPLNIMAAYSALLGALICLIPNAYFARRVFKHRGALAAQEIVRAFYVGEAIKLALTAGLFALVFIHIKPLDVLMLFVGFVAVQAAVWLTPILAKISARTGASS